MKLRIPLILFNLISALLICPFFLTGCHTSFDSAAYAEASLSYIYHGKAAAYSDLLGITQETAQTEREEFLTASISRIAEQYNLSLDPAELDSYVFAWNSFYLKAKFEVGSAKEQVDGSFQVAVTLHPVNLLIIAKNHLSDSLDHTNGSTKTSQIFLECLQAAIRECTYGEAVEVQLSILKTEDASFYIPDSEISRIENLLFPNLH